MTGGRYMDLFELSTQSFVVKIWIEETAEEAGETLWRGHVTHAHSGERQYFEDLEDILRFMRPFLQEMGIETRSKRPFSRWFRRWRMNRRSNRSQSDSQSEPPPEELPEAEADSLA